jgi:hypothetical protein
MYDMEQPAALVGRTEEMVAAAVAAFNRGRWDDLGCVLRWSVWTDGFLASGSTWKVGRA